MPIGIFKGKRVHYNFSILKVLVEKGPLKPWQIAKEIFIKESFYGCDCYYVSRRCIVCVPINALSDTVS